MESCWLPAVALNTELFYVATIVILSLDVTRSDAVVFAWCVSYLVVLPYVVFAKVSSVSEPLRCRLLDVRLGMILYASLTVTAGILAVWVALKDLAGPVYVTVYLTLGFIFGVFNSTVVFESSGHVERVNRRGVEVLLGSAISAVSTCVICLDEMAVGQQEIVLPCSHRFHEGCVKAWFMHKDTCPVCRSSLEALV
jgi:hypothetical protein